MQLKSRMWQSWDILRRFAQYNLARYGHVQTLDGQKIACEWALNDEVVRTLIEQQPWKPLGKDDVGFAGRLRGMLGLTRVAAVRPKSTPAPKTPSTAPGFPFRGRRTGKRWGPTQ